MGQDPLIVFQSAPRGTDRVWLRAQAERISAEVAEGRRFCCLLTRDAELQRLNSQFRGKDEPTDVLSFPSAAPDGSIGDLAISIDRARAQSAEFGHTLEQEIAILMLHGVLHLLGYDHETDRGQMRRLESRWRKTLDFPTALIERVSTRAQSPARRKA